MELSLVILHPSVRNVKDCIPLFKARRSEPVVELNEVEAILDITKDGLPCVILVSIVTESDVANCLVLVKSFSKKKDKLRRIIVVSQVENAKLSNSLLTRGVADFLPAKTAPSTLVFKIALQLSQIQRLLHDASEAANVKSRTQNPDNGLTNVAGSNPAFTKSKEILPTDVWIIKGSAPKKVGIQWVIDMEGPDPDSGAWEPVTDQSSREEKWKWVPFDQAGKTVKQTPQSDHWQFTGNKPVFDAELRKWKFVATKPELAHQSGKAKTGSKIKFDADIGITIASDNPAAEARIQESKRIGDLIRLERAALAARNVESVASAGAGQTVVPKASTVAPTVNVPVEQFGDELGNWEAVDKAGWAYVTPEMKAQSPAEIREKKGIWTLEGDEGVRKPTLDASQNGWNFSHGSMPERAEKFDDLSPEFQNYLQTLNPEQAKKLAAEQRAKGPSPSPAGKATQPQAEASGVFLKLFFELAEMVNSNKPAAVIQHKIVHSVKTLLELESVTLLQTVEEGAKRHAHIVASTDAVASGSSILDLEFTVYKEALTEMEPRFYASEGLATFPLTDPKTPKKIEGSLILRSASNRALQKDPQVKKLISLVSKQLSRLMYRPKAA